MQPEHSPADLKSRVQDELKRYALVSIYLFVCFSVILLYDAAQNPSVDTPVVLIGIALCKALVLGKFVLLGEALQPGSRIKAATLLQRVALRTLGMLLVLVLLKLIEELILGLVRGQGIGESMARLGNMSGLELVAPVLLMLVILIPLMSAIELDKALDAHGLKGIILATDNPQHRAS